MLQSALTPKASDDPCDVVLVAPDAVRVAPADDELSSLLQQAARHRSDVETRAASDCSAGAAAPPVDTTFRPTSHDAALDSTGHGSMAGRAVRAFVALLLAGCIGLAAVAWKSYGEVATTQIARLATQLTLIASQPPETPAPATPSDPPVVRADAANAASPQPPPPARTVPETVAPAAVPSPDSTLLLQSMARDLASLGQEVEQLKAGIVQIKASQQQMSRNVARVSDKPSDQNLRARASGPAPRPAAAQARKPLLPSPPAHAAAAAGLPPQPAAAYYVPRQPEPQPQTTAEPSAEPDFSVPRPPMPVR
jgi:hypothetical protein